AKELLDRLETMLKLVSGYFGSPCRKTIRMYVGKEIDRWPQAELQNMEPGGVASIRRREGVTLTSTLSLSRGGKLVADTVAYVCADQATPQHEAIPGCCGLTFGSVGPAWYAEGMAEVVQYWSLKI